MKHVCYFRHALALDERRVKFLPEYAYGLTTGKGKNASPGHSQARMKSPGTHPHIMEVWFAGTHSDM